LEYRDQLIALSRTIMDILAKGLPNTDKAAVEFAKFCDSPIANVRLLHYPPQADSVSDKDQVGAGAHTDFGAVTLLLQDKQSGLQVLKQTEGSEGEWINVPPNPSGYVVNVGDMLQMWTNGEYRSNIHRVVNRSGEERYSVPFFFDGNLDYVLRPLDGSGDGESGVTVEDFMKERFKRTYGN
jgi:isopenicillin N synthase-like dioxygenase